MINLAYAGIYPERDCFIGVRLNFEIVFNERKRIFLLLEWIKNMN